MLWADSGIVVSQDHNVSRTRNPLLTKFDEAHYLHKQHASIIRSSDTVVCGSSMSLPRLTAAEFSA